MDLELIRGCEAIAEGSILASVREHMAENKGRWAVDHLRCCPRYVFNFSRSLPDTPCVFSTEPTTVPSMESLMRKSWH